MKIYGANLSPFVRKVLTVCALKELEYEHVMVMPGNLPDGYLKISPLGKIPALEDGELSISDSSVICEYLEERYPAIATMPTDPVERARARWLEEYGDSKFVEAVAPFFFEHVLKRVMGMGDPDIERLEQLARDVIPERMAYLEQQLPEEGFLFGTLCTADIALASPIITAGYGGFETDAALYPKTAAFLERVKAHPAMVAVLEAEGAMLAEWAGSYISKWAISWSVRANRILSGRSDPSHRLKEKNGIDESSRLFCRCIGLNNKCVPSSPRFRVCTCLSGLGIRNLTVSSSQRRPFFTCSDG